jgi:hypothetical protein
MSVSLFLGLQKATGPPAIDPNVSLCPYELAGLCLDSLAPINTSASISSATSTRESCDSFRCFTLQVVLVSLLPRQMEVNASEPPRRKRRVEDSKITVPAACEAPVVGDASAPGLDGGLSSSDDFVFVGEISKGGDDGTDGETGAEEKADLVFTNKKMAPVWWLSEKEVASLPLPSSVSFSAFLETLGYRFSKALTEVSLSKEIPRTAADACLIVGMAVDCTGLSIHAGRYDIAAALKSMVGQLMDMLKESTFKRIIRKGMDIVRNEENRAFSFTAVAQHPFLVAFETRLVVALLSAFLEQFGRFLRGSTGSDASCSAWHASLNAFERAFSPSKKALDHSRNCLSDIRSNLFRLEYSIVEAEEGESEESRTHRSVVHWLLEDVCRGTALKKAASEASSIRCLIDDVLEPTWLAAKETFGVNLVRENRSTAIFLRAVLTIGYIVLGAVEKAANLIPVDHLIADVKTELAELYSTIDKILLALRRAVRQLPWMDLLLSPLFAANVSLACTIQLCDKSQHRLESRSGREVGSTHNRPPLLTFPLETFCGISLIATAVWCEVEKETYWLHMHIHII